jgi:hypothetical protein
VEDMTTYSEIARNRPQVAPGGGNGFVRRPGRMSGKQRPGERPDGATRCAGQRVRTVRWRESEEIGYVGVEKRSQDGGRSFAGRRGLWLAPRVHGRRLRCGR